MNRYRMTLPDVGEGVAEAELVEWYVAVGDEVTAETVVADVLTDKATVEVSAPVAGTVAALHGEPGDILAVGGDLIEFDTGGDDAPDDRAAEEPEIADTADDGAPTAADEPPAAAEPLAAPATEALDEDEWRPPSAEPRESKPTASPAVRARARDLAIDLASVRGTGPGGRVVHADLDRLLSAGTAPTGPTTPASDAGTPHPIRGVRRRIAQRLTDAWQEIPHITYVESVDATELERLRAELNREADERGVRLTLLPFLATALAIAAREQPRLNAHYDHANETLTTFDAVHVGIATQTDDGLLVPVVRHVESLGIWELAVELGRVTSAARDGTASRAELSGSTITITSLGAMGGIVTTPILNAPEVAIVGVNKLERRPVWRAGSFEPRAVFNLSSSFDHRMVDGWDAATFIQRVKALLETPALLFVE